MRGGLLFIVCTDGLALVIDKDVSSEHSREVNVETVPLSLAD